MKKTICYEVAYMRWMNSGRKEYFIETYPTYINMVINRWIRVHLDGLRCVRTIKRIG